MGKKIIGVTVGTTTPRPDWLQENKKKADFIRNKPDIESMLIGSLSPAESVGDTITWDGIEKPNHLTFKRTIDLSVFGAVITEVYAKISNSVPSFEQVDKKWKYTWLYYNPDGTIEIRTIRYNEYAYSSMQTVYENGVIRLHYESSDESFEPCVFIIPQANLEADDVTFPEAGVYVRWLEYANRRQYVTSLTIPGFNFEALPKDNRTIKPSRLPYAVTEAADLVPQIVGGVDVVVGGGGAIVYINEVFNVKFGISSTVHTQVVNELPDVLLQSDLEIGTVHLYVINETGIVYCRLGEEVMTLGMALFDSEGFDKGWVDTITDGYGVYAFRRESILIDKTFTQSGKAADAYEVGKIEQRLRVIEETPWAEEVSV